MILNYKTNPDKLQVALITNNDRDFNLEYLTATYPPVNNIFTLNNKLQLVKRKNMKRVEPNYFNSFDVIADCQKIGEMHTDSRLAHSQEYVKFVFENEVFYTAPGWLYYLPLLNEVGLFAATPSLFEIALDVQLSKPLVPRISHKERHSTLDIHNPKPVYKTLRSKIICTKQDNGAGYNFGHSATSAQGSGKQVKIYDKTDELNKPGNEKKKKYTNAFHAENGFDLSMKVERIEAVITNKWLVANKINISVYDLSNPEILKTILIKAIGDVFKFVKISDKPVRNKQGNYVQKAIDLFPTTTIQAQPVTLPPRLASTVTVSDQAKRTTHNTLIKQFIAQGEAETLAMVMLYERTNTPPKNQCWHTRRRHFAQDYEGYRTPQIQARIDQLSA